MSISISPPTAVKPSKLQELLARARADKLKAETLANHNQQIDGPPASLESSTPTRALESDAKSAETNTADWHATGRTGEAITYNPQQAEFIRLAQSGQSCVLIGAAGTGKTTCQQGAIQALIQSGRAGILNAAGHKYLPNFPVPGIVVIAFTRRAVNNIRRFMPANMRQNCLTHHKLLEYEPVFYDIFDNATGESKRTMRFEPMRNEMNPLPSSIHTIIIEEGSMYSVPMENELKKALSHEVQFIYLGDIQQLPPVFGSAVLGFRMLDLPVVELTEVYRQALGSPIISLAHRVLSGKEIEPAEIPNWKRSTDLGKLTLHPWKKQITDIAALQTTAHFFKHNYAADKYNPDTDMILMPFNKAFGTIELNCYIATNIAKKHGRKVYEIICGFEKKYFSVGDKVLYDKEDAEIISISHNPRYLGRTPQEASENLDYWGNYSQDHVIQGTDNELSDDEFDLIMGEAALAGEDEERVKSGSHIIKLYLKDSEREIEISSAGDLNALSLSYCLTIHKSQGSEWDKVFLVLHQSHAVMIQRELLYTAITRAKKELFIICEPNTFMKGIRNQRIKGNTLAEKAEFFKGKLENLNKEGLF